MTTVPRTPPPVPAPAVRRWPTRAASDRDCVPCAVLVFVTVPEAGWRAVGRAWLRKVKKK